MCLWSWDITVECQEHWRLVPSRGTSFVLWATHPRSWKTPQVYSPTGPLVSEIKRTERCQRIHIFLKKTLSLDVLLINIFFPISHNANLFQWSFADLDGSNVSGGFDGSYGDLALLQLGHNVVCSSNNESVSALMRRKMKVCVLPQVDNL